MNTEVSYWNRFEDTRNNPRTVAFLAQKILGISLPGAEFKPGHAGTNGHGERIRDDLQERIERMPVVTFAGTFGVRRSLGKFREHSGLISVDYERLKERRTNPESWKRKAVRNLPGLAMAFTTPSKNGARLVFRVDPVPRDHGEHREAFREVCRMLEEAGMSGWNETGADVTALVFIARDARMYIAEDPEVIRWREEAAREQTVDGTEGEQNQ